MNNKQTKLLNLLYLLEGKRIVPERLKNTIFEKYTESDIYNTINKFYENETKIKLEITDQKNKEKLYQWLKEKERYPLLNYLIKETIEHLTQEPKIKETAIDTKDLFMLNNIKPLIQIMLKQLVFSLSNTNYYTTNLTKINRNTTNKYVYEILTEIDPTLEWLNIYQEAQAQKRIIYLNDYSQAEKKNLAQQLEIKTIDEYNNCCLLTKDSIYIILTETETLKDISTKLHEFAHYIFYYKNPIAKPQRTLVEFSSIFYELYALEFLKRQGYNQDEISTINSQRLENTADLASYNKSLFYYIEIFIKKEIIKEEEDIKHNQESIATMNAIIPNELKKMLKQTQPNLFDPIKSAHNECDNCIKKLILNSWDFYLMYPYVIGNYLAVYAIKNISSTKNILNKIKYYTENSATVDPYEIFFTVGCNPQELKSLKQTKNTYAKKKKR